MTERLAGEQVAELLEIVELLRDENDGHSGNCYNTTKTYHCARCRAKEFLLGVK